MSKNEKFPNNTRPVWPKEAPIWYPFTKSGEDPLVLQKFDMFDMEIRDIFDYAHLIDSNSLQSKNSNAKDLNSANLTIQSKEQFANFIHRKILFADNILDIDPIDFNIVLQAGELPFRGTVAVGIEYKKGYVLYKENELKQLFKEYNMQLNLKKYITKVS
jgi:hypothetical protein